MIDGFADLFVRCNLAIASLVLEQYVIRENALLILSYFCLRPHSPVEAMVVVWDVVILVLLTRRRRLEGCNKRAMEEQLG